MKYRQVLLSILFLAACAPGITHAQEASPELERAYLEKAVVREASPSVSESIEATGLSSEVQTLTIEVLSGTDKGKIATFENDYTQLEKGDVFYVRHTVGGFSTENWSVADPYRLNVLLVVGIIFLVLLLIFGGLQGIRGLASLIGSLVLIFYVLIPNIYAGHSPILVSIGVASLIIVIGSYITHGFNRTTTVAMISMLVTVGITGIATYIAIHTAQLSGFTSEENVYLNFNTNGRIDMVGLLFGGVMIGLLGVLYDIAIGQAITVEELTAAGTHYSRKDILTRALRIGREHIGALVNTLAIAYVGVSLPLLLLFQQADTSVGYVLNSELFATEILRILMGSIGLVLAVPITTVLTTYLLYGKVSTKTGSGRGHHHS